MSEIYSYLLTYSLTDSLTHSRTYLLTFALIHTIRIFSIEKEEYSFHVGLKTRTGMFCLKCYINEFIRIINWNNLNETFQAYRKNYSIVARK